MKLTYDYLKCRDTKRIQLIQVGKQWYACFDFECDSDDGVEMYQTCLKLKSPDAFTLIAEYESGPWTPEKFNEYGGGRPDDEAPINYKVVRRD